MRIPIFDEMSDDVRVKIIALFEEALQRDPSSPWAEFERINIDIHSRRCDSAVRRLEVLTRSADPKISEQAYSQLAQLYHFAGENEKALQLYRHAADLEGRPGHATAFMAGVYADMGDLETAENLFRSVIGALNEDDDFLAFGAGQEFARLLHKTGRTSKAIALLKDLIRRYPERFELKGVLKFYEPEGAV